MAKGPEETRLDSWLDGSHEGVVDLGGEAWSKAAALLAHVQLGIERAAAQAAVLGGETGPAAARAFARSAEAMGNKSDELRAGGHALSLTARAVSVARQQRREMGPPPNEPMAPEPPAPGAPPTDKDLEKQAAYRSSVAAYQHDQQQREARSKAITSDMDVQYRSATETMKKIHGEPDPVHKTSTTNGSGGVSSTPAGSGGQGRTATPTTYDGSSSPSGTGGHSPGLVTSGPGHAPASSTSAPPATHGSTTALPAGNAQSTWSESAPGAGVPGALSTGTSGTTAPASSVGAGAGITGGAGLMGGLAAGGLGGNLTGGVRGAITPVSSSSATGVRPIGSAARSGVSGTLGRGTTTVGTGSTGGGSSRSGGRSGSTSRGTAGGRGASTGATGRGGDRSRDRSKKSERDHFDEEWELEDEDIAPPVLD